MGGSRLIITSRYLPADVAPLPPTVREWQLGEFGEAAFLKLLLRDATVEQRYRAGELPHALLVRLHPALGATPRFLGQIRSVLASLPADELTGELDRIALPSATEEAAAPVVREAVAQWRALALALAHGDASGGQDLWSVYGMLRHWLLAPGRLSAEERRTSHLAAGEFLVELDRQDREGELGVSWVACLLEARAQYLAAGALDQARAATKRISGSYARQGLYAELERLHNELLQLEVHASRDARLAGPGASGRGAQHGPARGLYRRAGSGGRGRSAVGKRSLARPRDD